jgi:hypothetical protein
MIYYNWEYESWLDENQDNFRVGMTPEGDPKDLEKEFDSPEKFWEWYNSKRASGEVGESQLTVNQSPRAE